LWRSRNGATVVFRPINIIDPFAIAAATVSPSATASPTATATAHDTATADDDTADDDTRDIITIIDTQDRSKRLIVRLGAVLQRVDGILGRVGMIVE
jgi:hypothetical protein